MEVEEAASRQEMWAGGERELRAADETGAVLIPAAGHGDGDGDSDSGEHFGSVAAEDAAGSYEQLDRVEIERDAEMPATEQLSERDSEQVYTCTQNESELTRQQPQPQQELSSSCSLPEAEQTQTSQQEPTAGVDDYTSTVVGRADVNEQQQPQLEYPSQEAGEAKVEGEGEPEDTSERSLIESPERTASLMAAAAASRRSASLTLDSLLPSEAIGSQAGARSPQRCSIEKMLLAVRARSRSAHLSSDSSFSWLRVRSVQYSISLIDRYVQIWERALVRPAGGCLSCLPAGLLTNKEIIDIRAPNVYYSKCTV